MVYRRDWQPVLVTAGLTKVHKGREYLPSLVRVRCGPTSDRVLVKMLKGQAPETWERVAVNLAHGFGATLVRVREGDRPGRLWLEFVRKDALAVPISALPVPDAADVDLRIRAGRWARLVAECFGHAVDVLTLRGRLRFMAFGDAFGEVADAPPRVGQDDLCVDLVAEPHDA